MHPSLEAAVVDPHRSKDTACKAYGHGIPAHLSSAPVLHCFFKPFNIIRQFHLHPARASNPGQHALTRPSPALQSTRRTGHEKMDFEPFRTLSKDSFEPANPEGLGLRKIMENYGFPMVFLRLFMVVFSRDRFRKSIRTARNYGRICFRYQVAASRVLSVIYNLFP